MKIVREIDGKPIEFTLTNDELVDAYYEQEHIYDTLDILSYFDDYSDEDFVYEYGRTREEVMLLLNEIAYEMRRKINKYDMDWLSARDEAVAEML